MIENFHLIIMGPPGSGKGTQADLLADKFDFRHISTGALYREIAKQPTELGKQVKAFLDVGELVDDKTTFELVDKHLKELKGRLILDGYPRTLAQAKEEAVEVDAVVYLQVDDTIVIDRMLSRGREGETREMAEKRVQVYHELTEPILDYYRQQGKLKEVNGNGTIEEVYALIVVALGLSSE